MEVAERLRELREARNMSQGDIEKRSGLLRCYISRVENGHTVPSLDTLEKFAKALGVDFQQIFASGADHPPILPLPGEEPLTPGEKRLVRMFRRLPPKNQRTVMALIASFERVSLPDQDSLLTLARHMSRRKPAA